MDDTTANEDHDSYHEVIFTEWIPPMEALTTSDDPTTPGAK